MKHFADDQQKQMRCQKIHENRMRRDVRVGSSSMSSASVGGPSMSADSSDAASLSPESERTSSTSYSVEHREFTPGEQTHVIASAIDQSVLQGLPSWCTGLLDEVCIKTLSLIHQVSRWH